jgi:SAM-dependent methyltransferase
MSDTRNTEFDLDVLMRRIRDDVARRRKPTADPAFVVAVPSETIRLQRLPESSESIARKDHYSLAEFLTFQDEDFVHNAYRGILRREPDAGGFAAYLELLREGGLAKVEVLGRMRFSAEGRAAGVRIRGLPFAFALRSACRVPVLGRMLGIVQYLYRLPNIVSKHEQLEAAFYQRQRELHRQINIAEGMIELGILQVQRSLDATDGATRAKIDSVRAEMATATQATALEQSVDVLSGTKADREELGRIAERVIRKADVAQVAAIDERVGATEQRLTTLREDVAPRLVAVERALDLAALTQDGVRAFDAFYAAFENHFRGTIEDIRQRVAVYVPVIREARAGTATTPVLDVGCGRGEWLDLLKENGLTAQGVDLNRVTVAQCRERGLSVVEGEAIEYLRALDADSLGAVTAMHVIEHIPFRRLIVLFDEVLRVLQPGGVAIFETPNPENLMVGACNFYNDPTHERPLPPEPTKVVAELRGFIDVSILRLHPMPENVQVVDGAPAVRDLINRLVYGAQDYALIARKPNQ